MDTATQYISESTYIYIYISILEKGCRVSRRRIGEGKRGATVS